MRLPLGLLLVGAGAVIVYFLLTSVVKDSENNSFDEVRKILADLESRDNLRVATLAGGCFWCMEGPFEQMDGVEEVISGFSGGTVPNPTYNRVVEGKTGHREVVQIYYDPKKVSFKEILDIYWYQIDPTDPGGQFSDRGEQYKTAIYYHNQEQKEVAKQSKESLEQSGRHDKPIATEILPATNFYPAEDYHQNFYKTNETRYKLYKKGSGREDYIKRMEE